MSSHCSEWEILGAAKCHQCHHSGALCLASQTAPWKFCGVCPWSHGVTITECDCHSVRLVWDSVISPAFPGPGLWFGQENSLLLLTASAHPPSDTQE